MKPFILSVISGALLLCSTLQASEKLDLSTAQLRAHLLTQKQLKVSGAFAPYDFAGVSSAFDWTFTTSSGTVYQLQGKAPIQSDVFGWKEVNVTPGTTQWYMSYLGDWDGDGKTKFDWVLVGNGTNAVYKLAGVADNGNFAYSSKIDLPYRVSSDKSTITFGDASTPQYSVSHPNSGDITATITQTNGSDTADFYMVNNQLSKVAGISNGTAFTIIYNGDTLSSYTIGKYRLDYSYNSDGSVNFKLYTNDQFTLESSNVALRSGLTQQEYNQLMKEAGGNILQAAIILRDKVINNPFLGVFSGVCDSSDARYDPDLCTKLYEQALYLITHVNSSEEPVLQEISQNVPPQEDSESQENQTVSLEELYAYNTKYFNDLYEHFDQCPYDEPEHKYTNLVLKINEGTLYCHYKDQISTGFTIDPNDVEWGKRISVRTKEGTLTQITQTLEDSQIGGYFTSGRYSSFSLYENGKSTYATNVVNPADPNSDYIYKSYNSGVKDYTARYDKDFKLISFCQYDSEGKSILWCDPEF
jgi:hypothetical protein